MKVVTFGELMVRLQPFNYERFVQANSWSSPLAAARPTLLFLWLTTAGCSFRHQAPRTRDRPGSHQQPAPLWR